MARGPDAHVGSNLRLTFDDALPVVQRRAEVAAAIAAHQVVILCGETGSGKTTQLPKILLEMGRGGGGGGAAPAGGLPRGLTARRPIIAHTQPRRLAARAVAARIAEELGEPLGATIGYQVRFGGKQSAATRVKLMTDGILLAEAAGDDPELRAYDTVIIDEAHERSLNIDFLLGYLRRILPRRPDLKVIITSATIDPARFSDHFGGAGAAPVLTISGRMFPVEVRYRPGENERPDAGPLDLGALVDAVDEVCAPALPPGDVLVFLPGEKEIREVATALGRSASAGGGGRAEGRMILPLYSRLSEPEQDRIFHPAPPGVRKIVLATNVAETSLTVPGIRYVVDSGLARVSRFDARRGVRRLPIEMIARAAAAQRAGRCGRVSAGICVRVYGERALTEQPAFLAPEIQRTDLSAVVLRAKALRLGPVAEFPFLDQPEARAVMRGAETLFELGALERPEEAAALTPIGVTMAQLPADPRTARMLLAGAEFGCLPEMVVLAAVLEVQEPTQRPQGREEAADVAHSAFRSRTSDFTSLLNLWQIFASEVRTRREAGAAAWCREHFVSAARMFEWIDVTRQLARSAQEAGITGADERLLERVGAAPDHAVHKGLLAGLIANVLRRDDADGGREYRGMRGNIVALHPGSALWKSRPKWAFCAELVETTKLYARTVGLVDPEWVEAAAPQVLVRAVEGAHLDEETGEPVCFERVTLLGLPLAARRKVALAEVDPVAARRVLIERGVVENAVGAERPFEVHNARLRERAETARAMLREGKAMFDAAAAAALIDEVLPKAIATRRALGAWLNADSAHGAALRLDEARVLRPEALAALRSLQFPEDTLLGGVDAPLIYVLAPGKDADGVTARLPLLALAEVEDSRLAWGVPGWLAEKIAALVKALPRAVRADVEGAARAHHPELSGDFNALVRAFAADVAGLMEFAAGGLSTALSQTIEVAFGVTVPEGAWPMAAAPEYLTLRLEIVDDSGRVIASGRDAAELKQRLAGRLTKAKAAAERARFAQRGMTAWTFGPLPALERNGDGGRGGAPAAPGDLHPALLDEGDSVALTLVRGLERARELTRLGVRRLFALALREELMPSVAALAQREELRRWFGAAPAMGTPNELDDALLALTCEKVFLTGQSLPRDALAFAERLSSQRGRLAPALQEVAEVFAKFLDPRAIVAKRLAGGTNRMWAASMADIREQGAYLMPPGFLKVIAWERLVRYPLYVGAMRQRLLNLREDGSGTESGALAQIGPQHKRLTAWVAAAMASERERGAIESAGAAHGHGGEVGQRDEFGPAGDSVTRKAQAKAAIPQSRRAAPTVNADAGTWAMAPGALPIEIAAFRWGVEEVRAALLGAGMEDAIRATVRDAHALEALWRRAEGEPGARPGGKGGR
ncbi:ATP-dependent RNA helicase HrpA [soil metagenome]